MERGALAAEHGGNDEVRLFVPFGLVLRLDLLPILTLTQRGREQSVESKSLGAREGLGGAALSERHAVGAAPDYQIARGDHLRLLAYPGGPNDRAPAVDGVIPVTRLMGLGGGCNKERASAPIDPRGGRRRRSRSER